MGTKYSRGVTCQVSAFYVEDPPSDILSAGHSWMAVATAHVYDANATANGRLTPEMAILAGETMRTVSAKASATTERAAMMGALKGLMDDLAGMGFARGSA